MPSLLNVRIVPAAAAAALVAALGWTAASAQANQASFKVEGTVVSPNPALGYLPGAAVSFSWVLDAVAVSQARFSGPIPCCGGGLGWAQGLFSATPQLWSSITGTGLSGAWRPPVDKDDGSITMTVGTFPQPNPGAFQMLANSRAGFSSGLEVNGRPVTALQMNAVYQDFDLVARIDAGSRTCPMAHTLTPRCLA